MWSLYTIAFLGFFEILKMSSDLCSSTSICCYILIDSEASSTNDLVRALFKNKTFWNNYEVIDY